MRPNEPSYTPKALADRLRDMDRQILDLQRTRNPPPPPHVPDPTPLVFHWSETVVDLLDVRNGPGEFGADGVIHMVRYRWDTSPSSTTTIEWELDGVLVDTHTLPASTDPHVERPAIEYAQEGIVATITGGGTGGEGLTAFVYFRPGRQP